MIEFAWPYLLFLLPLPVLVYWLAPKADDAGKSQLRVPFFKTIEQLSQNTKSISKKNWLQTLVFSLIWVLCVIGAARPMWVGEPIMFETQGRNLILAVDVSGSMDTADMSINGQQVDRLSVVKYVLKDFISRRKGDRMSLILFGTQAYLQAPLTLDIKTLQIFLDEAMIGIAGPQTAIGDAIGLAVKRLKERPGEEQVLVLLTDGANNAGVLDPITAANLAKEKGIKIYTIGVGAGEMLVDSFFGQQRVNPSQELERGEQTLQEVAKLTGGKYFRGKNREQIEKIYALINSLEPIKGDEKVYRPIKALFYWPAGIAFSLALALFAWAILKEQINGGKNVQ